MKKVTRSGQPVAIATVISFVVLSGCVSSPHKTAATPPLLGKTIQALSKTDYPSLPTGKWEGNLEFHTIPDVDNDGTWHNDVVISNCNGIIQVQWANQDGTLDAGLTSQALTLFPNVYLLYRENIRNPGPHKVGWVESQHWTLVDASPKDWTATLTRTVLNDPSQSDSPWFTFRWVGWGSMQYSPDSCD